MQKYHVINIKSETKEEGPHNPLDTFTQNPGFCGLNRHFLHFWAKYLGFFQVSRLSLLSESVLKILASKKGTGTVQNIWSRKNLSIGIGENSGLIT